MRILVTGASGFVGKPLVSLLAKMGHEVVSLRHEIGSFGQTVWQPAIGSLEDFDAVVHLAGEPLTFERWSAEKKKQIHDSRKEGTASLCHALSCLLSPPLLFISASAVGIYGNRGEELLDERSSPGHGFLADVCIEWERASKVLEDRGTRTVHLRFGMVLGPGGGALEKMVHLYRRGLGGNLSTGQQWVSWIALTDLIHAIHHILLADFISGPVNAVSTHAVRQKEFSRILAALLHRPAFLTAPAWLLRLRFGEMADELLLSSARVVPQKLCKSAFKFRYPDLQDALRICI